MNLPDLGRRKIDELVDEWIIGNHAERNRAIFRRRMYDGITFERLAEEFELSPKQARRIFHQCEHKIFNHFPG